MSTTPSWVIKLCPQKINLLIVTENYPGNPNATQDSTYFYRSLQKGFKARKANNLLNNLCKALNISGVTEQDRLLNFLAKGYFLIDSYPAGSKMNKTLIQSTLKNKKHLANFASELEMLNPKQILFTCKGSNQYMLESIWTQLVSNGSVKSIKSASGIIPATFTKRDDYKHIVFNSPSNRAYAVFKQQLDTQIKAGNIKL